MDADLARSYAFCDDLSRRQAKNFYWSFRLLPAEGRRSMSALYAFMRHTDDLADEPGDPSAKAESLRLWRSDLDDALGGRPDAWPGLPALADTVARRGVPPRHLHEVIDGVEMDLAPRVYPTFEDLYGYCYRVASAVGLCCLAIWGYRSDGGRAEAMAEACGVALQLTNILRDVGEDARNGRI
jgi:phytoene synthase